jgi:hypothetical protein
MQGLNRQETEDYVIDLYYNQKKTFREIQKILRKSPRDLKKILDKVEPERASLSESSRAYQMFNERAMPVSCPFNSREKVITDSAFQNNLPPSSSSSLFQNYRKMLYKQCLIVFISMRWICIYCNSIMDCTNLRAHKTKRQRQKQQPGSKSRVPRLASTAIGRLTN